MCLIIYLMMLSENRLAIILYALTHSKLIWLTAKEILRYYSVLRAII